MRGLAPRRAGAADRLDAMRNDTGQLDIGARA